MTISIHETLRRDAFECPVTRTWRVNHGLMEVNVYIGCIHVEVAFVAGYPTHRQWKPCGPLESFKKNTGTFRAIDRALRHVTAEYLMISQDSELEIIGMDSKRNSHNAAAYGDALPEGWRMEIVRSRQKSHPRADENGVIGIRIVSTEPNMRRRTNEAISEIVRTLDEVALISLGAEMHEKESQETLDLFGPR